MRPSVFQVGGTLYWVIQTRNPDTMVLKDADSDPTVAVRKNGASVGDSVTVTKRSATTGIYDCSYNPSAEVEGDAFTLEESATVTGTTTASATYTQTWNVRCIAVERGTNNASTFDPTTQAVALDSASIDAIWNEVLTGATHNIASSAGRRLRQLADTVVLVDGVCDAASNAGTDSTGTITLEVGTTTACVGQAIRCENQVRYIASYNAGTRVAQLDRPWCVVPDAGDEYVIFNVRNPLVGLASLALAGSTAAVVNDVLVDTGTTLPAQIAPITDGIGWTLASLYGACANPQAADSLVQLTINGHDYSGQYAGLTATGVRTAPTLSKV
jgi:hypothetical protein